MNSVAASSENLNLSNNKIIVFYVSDLVAKSIFSREYAMAKLT